MQKSEFETTLTQLAENQQQLQQTVAQLAQPRSNAQSMLYGGGAPAVRVGEDSMSSRGWSLLRAIGLKTGAIEPEQAKVERDIHQKLYREFVENGGLQRASGTSVLVPVSSRAIAPTNPQLALECQQAVAQGVAGGPDPDYSLWLQRQRSLPVGVMQTLTTSDDSTGGSLVAAPTQGDLIELVRANSILSRSGARNISLPPSGRLSLPKQTGSVTSNWVGESVTIPPSDIATGHLQLAAKKIASLLKSPNELVRFASVDVELLVRQDMALSAATKIDTTALTGVSASVSPKGLLNYSGINTLTASVTDTDGDTFSPQDPARMLAALESNNHQLDESVAFVMRAANLHEILETRADAVASGDGQGPYLFSTNRDDIRNGAPPRIRGYRALTSESVPRDREKGSATNLSMVICGKWNQLVIGTVGVGEIATTDKGDTAFQQDETWVRWIQHTDWGPRHESSFAVIDQLTSTFAD